MLYPFPEDLPFEAVSILIDKLRGKPIPIKTAVNAAWNLAGFAASQVTPDDMKIIGDLDYTDEEAVEMLENLMIKTTVHADGTVGFIPIPWAIVFRIAMRILASVL